MLRIKKLLLLSFCCSLACSAFAQKILFEVIDNYYLHNPFSGEFSVFLKDLMNDPRLTKKSTHKRTDSTLFHFRAEYISVSPFSFKPGLVELILAESTIQLSDSLPAADTILVYQLVGYTTSSPETVQAEFSRFEKKFGRKFDSSNFLDIVNNDQVVGRTYNYFINQSPVSPLSVSWGKLTGTQAGFVITVRLVIQENQAMIPFVSAAAYNQE